MTKFAVALITAAAALAATSAPSAAAELARGGKQATLESAPTAAGEKTYFKSVEFECAGSNCVGSFKGKAGRITTITEMQCAATSDGQAQGGQVAIGMIFVELLPIASRATDGASELVIVKTPTNFVLDGAQKADVGFFFFGTASFASCVVKGISKPS